VAVKASTGILLPFLLLGARRRRRALAGTAAAAGAVVVVGLAVFGGHAAGSISVLGSQQGLEA
jgi:hypothetical protein